MTMAFPDNFKPSHTKSITENGIQPYSGSAHSICNDFALKGLGGTSAEQEQLKLRLMQFHLKNEAQEWYHRRVFDYDREKRFWTFEEAVIAMYDRFVFNDSVHEAKDRLENTAYNSSKGIQGLYDDLKENAQRFAIKPNDQDVLRMPEDMRKYILFHGGLSPAVNMIEEFLIEGRSYEERQRESAYYGSSMGRRHTRTITHRAKNKTTEKPTGTINLQIRNYRTATRKIVLTTSLEIHLESIENGLMIRTKSQSTIIPSIKSTTTTERESPTSKPQEQRQVIPKMNK